MIRISCYILTFSQTLYTTVFFRAHWLSLDIHNEMVMLWLKSLTMDKKKALPTRENHMARSTPCNLPTLYTVGIPLGWSNGTTWREQYEYLFVPFVGKLIKIWHTYWNCVWRQIRQALAKEIATISTTLTLVVFVFLFYKGVIKFYIYNPFNYDTCLVQLHFSIEYYHAFCIQIKIYG